MTEETSQVTEENPLKRKADEISNRGAAQARRPPTFISMDPTIVEVKVGSEKKPFMVYKELLCYHSESSCKLFEGSFIEADKSVTELSDVSQETFRLFLHWLNAQPSRQQSKRPDSKAVPDEQGKDEVSSSKKQKTTTAESPAEVLASYAPRRNRDGSWVVKTRWLKEDKNLYILADKYSTPALRRDIMTVLVEYLDVVDKLTPLRYAPRAFRNLPSTSKFVEYIVKDIGHNWNPDDDHERLVAARDELPREFLLEALLHNLRCRNDSSLEQVHQRDIRDCCVFHEHDGGDEEILRCKQSIRPDRTFLRNFLTTCLSMAPINELPSDSDSDSDSGSDSASGSDSDSNSGDEEEEEAQ